MPDDELVKLFAHPLWPTLLRYFYIAQEAAPGVNGPRQRIEVRKRVCPPTVLDMVVKCAFCTRPMHSVRPSQRGVWVMNQACPLTVDVKCSRMKESHAQADAVRAAMAARTTHDHEPDHVPVPDDDDDQGDLF